MDSGGLYALSSRACLEHSSAPLLQSRPLWYPPLVGPLTCAHGAMPRIGRRVPFSYCTLPFLDASSGRVGKCCS